MNGGAALTIFLTSALVFPVTMSPAPASTPHPMQIESILAEAGIDKVDAPGAAVLVSKNGKVLFSAGYGVTDLHSLHRIDAQTNFRLASLTKQFTAMAIMLLVHDGKLRYEDRLIDIFPDFPAYGSMITIRNLLNHTSGLRDYEDLMAPPDPKMPAEQQQITDQGVLDLLEKQTGTVFAPGSKWAYSNSGYVLLGLVVEKVSRESFPDFLHNRIFQPLHMTSTVAYVRGSNDVPNRAFGHSFDNGKWVQTDQSPTSATLGDGGVYSSLEDMERWDRGLRNHTLLSAHEMQPALTPVSVPSGQATNPDGTPAAYGFGWFLNSYKGHRRMWHYGETIGFRTAIERFVDNNLTVIMLCNRNDVDPARVALKIADLYLQNQP